MDTRERYSELEEKLQTMGSTLEAYGHSSESEVIHRLQSEVSLFIVNCADFNGNWLLSATCVTFLAGCSIREDH